MLKISYFLSFRKYLFTKKNRYLYHCC